MRIGEDELSGPARGGTAAEAVPAEAGIPKTRPDAEIRRESRPDGRGAVRTEEAWNSEAGRREEGQTGSQEGRKA
jgi:hypothetical protein